MVSTVIVGTGDMAYALCHLFKNHNYNPSKNTLHVTKPGLSNRLVKKRKTFHDTNVPFIAMDTALFQADIIILAIPSYALKGFVGDHYKMLKNKILVDVTNSGVPGEDLHALLGLTEARWVKAFNDNGAVDMLLNQPYGKKSLVTAMCGSHFDAIEVVKRFAEEALGFEVKIVPTERYSMIAMHQNSLGEDWVQAAHVMVLLFVLTEIYAVVRYNVWKGYAWFHLPLQVTNKAICWTSLNAFALSMLPGVLARMLDAINGSKLYDKPRWIVWGLQIRKPLGLLALWFLGVHIIMSLLIFNPAYYSKFFVDPKAATSKMNGKGENSFFFGILGAALYFILGICSLPSVGSQMTSKSWQLIYGPVAWIALVFGTVHVLIMGVKGWTTQEKWPGNLPPITLTSTMIPLFVIFLKLVQIIGTRVTNAMLGKGSSNVDDDDDDDDDDNDNLFLDEGHDGYKGTSTSQDTIDGTTTAIVPHPAFSNGNGMSDVERPYLHGGNSQYYTDEEESNRRNNYMTTESNIEKPRSTTMKSKKKKTHSSSDSTSQSTSQSM